jgi:hypothetical protein
LAAGVTDILERPPIGKQAPGRAKWIAGQRRSRQVCEGHHLRRAAGRLHKELASFIEPDLARKFLPVERLHATVTACAAQGGNAQGKNDDATADARPTSGRSRTFHSRRAVKRDVRCPNFRCGVRHRQSDSVAL